MDGRLASLHEVWWSRVSQPNTHTWSEQDEPLHLQELSADKNDPDPKALACYGMLSALSGRMHLRFVSGRPVSQARSLPIFWSGCANEFKTWLHEHNQTVRQEAQTDAEDADCSLPLNQIHSER
jgi:hypothetical protein